MPGYPLFSRDELAAAFALVFRDAAVADQVATEWFRDVADSDVDAQGCFFHDDWNGQPSSPFGASRGLAVGTADLTDEERAEAERQSFGGWTDGRKKEYLLRLSDFHLGLVALVSPELYERMRVARGLTPESAAHSRAQLSSIARALRGDS